MQWLIMLPDIHVGGLMFYHGFFLLFFVSYPQSSLNGTQPYLTTWSEVSAIWKCMCEMWGIPSPYKLGAPKHLFSTISQLKGNFNRPISSIWNTIYMSGQVHCRIQGVSYIVSERHELVVHKWLQIGGEFSPTLRKFCIPFHC